MREKVAGNSDLLELVSTGVLAYACTGVLVFTGGRCGRLGVGRNSQPEQDYELNDYRECGGTEMYFFNH
ncbi:MAG: hypothetical protein JO077_10535 [Verrucomicrobia bacterium]|nr:hypothetical protein [Verrucomicrobiota bacterium]